MILTLLLTLPLLQADQTRPRYQIPSLSVADLVLESYRPTHVDASELFGVVQNTLGRNFYVQERGGPAGSVASNTALVGDVLLVLDEPAYAKSLLALCAKIDQPSAETGDGRATLSYRMRSVPLSRADRAVRVLGRRVDVQYDRSGGRILARGSKADLAALEELLESIDVPDPRVMVTCYLLQGAVGGESASAPLLPADLVADLGQLLPQFGFQAAGFAMLQSSIAVGSDLRLLIASERGNGVRFEFEVAAYDEEAGSLTAENCRLSGQTEDGPMEIFSTSTVLHAGEYTVLGATGSKPLLLVVRLEKL